MRHHRDDGSVTVETAVTFGIVGVVSLLAVQVVVLCHAYLLSGQAVREGVRQAALGATRSSVESMVRQIAHATDGTVTLTPVARTPGELVAVRYRVRAPVIPLIETIVPDLWIETEASMRIEVRAWN